MAKTQPIVVRQSEVDETLVTAAGVRKMFGDKSDMTLWRWQHDPSLGFPAPIYIARRRYWRRNELSQFLVKQDAASVDERRRKPA
jgi:hypothetical protein